MACFQRYASVTCAARIHFWLSAFSGLLSVVCSQRHAFVTCVASIHSQRSAFSGLPSAVCFQRPALGACAWRHTSASTVHVAPPPRKPGFTLSGLLSAARVRHLRGQHSLSAVCFQRPTFSGLLSATCSRRLRLAAHVRFHGARCSPAAQARIHSQRPALSGTRPSPAWPAFTLSGLLSAAYLQRSAFSGLLSATCSRRLLSATRVRHPRGQHSLSAACFQWPAFSGLLSVVCSQRHAFVTCVASIHSQRSAFSGLPPVARVRFRGARCFL